MTAPARLADIPVSTLEEFTRAWEAVKTTLRAGEATRIILRGEFARREGAEGVAAIERYEAAQATVALNSLPDGFWASMRGSWYAPDSGLCCDVVRLAAF